ncbi:MAG: hypothetical protein ABIE84_03375, partial [bacterium]
GHGSDIVLPHYHETDAKSMGHGYTMPKFTSDETEIKSYLLRLSEQVGRRLRKHNYRGNVIHASFGFGDYKFKARQQKVEDYTDDGYRIFQIAENILTPFYPPLHQRWRGGNPSTAREGVRYVGVSVSNLIHNLDQICLFEPDENKKRILKAMDEINDRFGEFTVERAGIMDTVLQGKTGMVAPKLYGLR